MQADHAERHGAVWARASREINPVPGVPAGVGPGETSPMKSFNIG